jgi:hypothetical protein
MRPQRVIVRMSKKTKTRAKGTRKKVAKKARKTPVKKVARRKPKPPPVLTIALLKQAKSCHKGIEDFQSAFRPPAFRAGVPLTRENMAIAIRAGSPVQWFYSRLFGRWPLGENKKLDELKNQLISAQRRRAAIQVEQIQLADKVQKKPDVSERTKQKRAAAFETLNALLLDVHHQIMKIEMETDDARADYYYQLYKRALRGRTFKQCFESKNPK